MATDLAPQPDGRDAVAPPRADLGLVDLTRPEFRSAPEAIIVPGALEVEVPRSEGLVDRWAVAHLARGAAGVLLALLAPLLVLLGALLLPVDESVQGAVLVAGWIGLGVIGRSVHRLLDRRRHR